ncbi:putative glycosyltransferase [Trichinella pseudospiralis]
MFALGRGFFSTTLAWFGSGKPLGKFEEKKRMGKLGGVWRFVLRFVFKQPFKTGDIHWPKKEKKRNKETAHCAVSIVDSWSYSNDNDTAYCSLNEPTIRPFARTSLPIWKLAFLSTPLTGALHC